MRYMSLLIFVAACSGNAASQLEPARRDSVLEIVVANQQSASASILNADGATMKHIPVGNGPHEAAISPNGRIAVVTVYGAQQAGNQLAIIDLENDAVMRSIDLGRYTRPHGAAFIGNSNSLVAVTSESTGNVVIVNIDTDSIEAAPTDARASHMVAVTANGARAYTANIIDDNVSELDLSARRTLRKFAVPARPEGIAVTPDGREVWVGSNTTGKVTVIATESGQVAHTFDGVTFPYRITPSPDGRLMAIVDGKADRVFFADVPQHTMLGSVSLTQPRGVAFSPDSRTAFVTLAHGELAVVDVATRTVQRTIAVQQSPDGVAVRYRAF